MIGKNEKESSKDWKKTEKSFQPLETFSRACEVAVVGAGPAGLMAAISAASSGARVILLEQLDRPGLKLLASGGGRCNLTNRGTVEDFMLRYGRQGRFAQAALSALPPPALCDWMEARGVPTFSPDGFHVYPASQSAPSVLEALLRECDKLGVERRWKARVQHLSIEEGGLLGVKTDASLEAHRVILACGGRGYPALGGTALGHELARQAGHGLADPLPALVPLLTQETWVRDYAGAAGAGARIWLDMKGAGKAGRRGDVLLTHRGLSGPAILNFSGEVAEWLRRRPAVLLRIDWTPDIPASEWQQRFEQWHREAGRKQLHSLLDQTLPAALAKAVCCAAKTPGHTQANQLSADQRDAVVQALTQMPLTITGTEGFEHAMVTRGGVPLREVDPKTLESRLLPGLFFAGELLDIDGPCGGYNLQWAFSSGWLAGRVAARP